MAEDSDAIGWMRARWEARGAPAPAQFAALFSVLRASALMTEEVDRVLKEQGLTRTGYMVMITLQASDGASRPLGQLSKRLLVHPTTVTMVIDQLENAGLVARRPHPTDRRTVLAELTPEGDETATRASKALAAVGFGLPGVDDATADRITADLRAVRRGLGDSK
ncbi:MarR family winged helix-turn-helix transcriptional regulator [Sporichthya polymorpha]|uniref:MarR family winged helix-turn-helix transcriptional regulator n=1 Tax=Sporichthya polymorpha TaxID=35751 RepID=UPI00037C8A48|nr:MarR family transcriptional regulator [Sporichthya polymorpha]